MKALIVKIVRIVEVVNNILSGEFGNSAAARKVIFYLF